MSDRPPPGQGMMAAPAPPDSAPPEPAPVPDLVRVFEHGGERWRAEAAGGGAGGTGGLGLAHFLAVQFFREGAARPVYEALVARGRFQHLFDEELVGLLERATPIPPA